ncbi:bifunctional 3-(3-hydroxy-phenyl)propionate/3-hydroxycinnamic acid hydroxylase [Variovorax sp. YR216]|uniref:bifunctional 3-(3-hydroxy-phenyl)propionate/3-hydroxycinnamic acid hydroxylase MhpA n=1 Tax=Variovorax sp. YR216 TaxID=1882828 RepID=UPI00089A4CCC|nr:bifunctional 3-(3-hydroxy-phenyl)propionate/3-hydroxycinnamic acid hydroxylase [Variovorax sp. YR216]SEB19313.1 single-component resorcinol 4-hydroxylase [Variovorax sp. YR216]
MTAQIPLYDVVQIGYGPVSEIMALALARQGRSVAVFERWKVRFALPRAVCIDHELYRVLSALGMSTDLPAVSHEGPMYRWFNADWKELLAIDWESESISGGPEVNFVHQPTLEKMFEDVVHACPNVELNLGWEAIEATQTPDYVELVVRDFETDERRTVRAKYLIGADGANSLVRQAIGSTQEDRGFEADWLVIDVLPNEGVTLDIPPAAQWCNPARPTTIVPAGVKDGRYFRRWEFMRLPHETREELEHEHVAWDLLAPWVKPDQATIVRHKVYTFRSLLANTWRKGRMLIAGDAAHVMPPFMGQGMCAGLRDDWNLAWKLNLVLDGKADDRLLDTYQPERRPHVSDVIDLSMYLGKIICIPDAAKAAERDRAFFSGEAPPPPAFPSLTDGILRRGADGAVQAPAGLLSPHGRVLAGAREGRFDEVAGLGFLLVSRSNAAEAALGEKQRAFLDKLGAKRVQVAARGTPARVGVLVDLDDKFIPYMTQHGIDTMLVRPDFYLYGAVDNAHEVNTLVDDLAADLQRHGVRLDGAPARSTTQADEPLAIHA